MSRGRRTDKKDLEREERRQDVLSLRRNGASLRAIAKELGIDPKTVMADIHAGLQMVIEETKDKAAENRALDLDRIDRALLAIMPKVQNGDVAAVTRLVSLLDHRAKLLGMYAPVKHEDVTWKTRAVAEIKAGTLSYQALVTAFDRTLADELFLQAGMLVEVDNG